jgi:hypothetical protein
MSAAHRSEQIVEHCRYNYVAGDHDEIECEAQPKTLYVRQNVGGGRRSVGQYKKAAARRHGGSPCQKHKQINGAGNSGFKADRYFGGVSED